MTSATPSRSFSNIQKLVLSNSEQKENKLDLSIFNRVVDIFLFIFVRLCVWVFFLLKCVQARWETFQRSAERLLTAEVL